MTLHRFRIALSDVDRNVYETLDLRVAQHPSENLRFLVTRTLAYCLEHAEGIGFSKGGLSNVDEPPVSIRDAIGKMLAWIDVGSPSVDRMKKAKHRAERVTIYTTEKLQNLRAEITGIEIWTLDRRLLDALERTTTWELTRSEGVLYFGDAYELVHDRS